MNNINDFNDFNDFKRVFLSSKLEIGIDNFPMNEDNIMEIFKEV